ncbi:unnamed protein product [Urochloa humidicola]
MAEPTLSEIATLLCGLTTKVDALEEKVVAIQQGASSSASSAPPPGTGEHHNDRPPRFQKMDFPKYDGKSDPLIFINRCESYFHHQRIVEEEKVYMASYNL